MLTNHALNSKRMIMRCLITLMAIACALSGCATAPAKDAIPPFRQGVMIAGVQTADAFTDVNTFLRQQQIERAIKQSTLTEKLFVVVIDASDMAKWSRAFALIDAYAEKLERLLSPDQRSGVEGELSELGAKIEGLHDGQIPAGVSAAFIKFGGLLVKMKTERDALGVIRKADPAIQDIFNAMMEAIGEDSGSGVRGTVSASWTQVLARIDVEQFRRAQSPGAKREAVKKYLKALEARDLQDQLLGSLNLSLATLAKAHQEIANGQPLSATAMIQFVQDEYNAYRKQIEIIQARREEETNGGGVK
jgi:hypothetical protein